MGATKDKYLYWTGNDVQNSSQKAKYRTRCLLTIELAVPFQLMFWIQIIIMFHKVYQCHAARRGISMGTPISSTNKTYLIDLMVNISSSRGVVKIPIYHIFYCLCSFSSSLTKFYDPHLHPWPRQL
jgi:hypothetical protein